jgi:hypothetical protein
MLDGDVGLTHQSLIHVRIIEECQDYKNEEINESSARLGFPLISDFSFRTISLTTLVIHERHWAPGNGFGGSIVRYVRP